MTMTGKTLLSTFSTKSGSAASFLFQFGTELVSRVDRCLMIVLCHVYNEEKTHFKPT